MAQSYLALTDEELQTGAAHSQGKHRIPLDLGTIRALYDDTRAGMARNKLFPTAYRDAYERRFGKPHEDDLAFDAYQCAVGKVMSGRRNRKRHAAETPPEAKPDAEHEKPWPRMSEMELFNNSYWYAKNGGTSSSLFN